MMLDELLSQAFDVSDALDPAPRAALASACQQLDIAPSRPSLGAAEAARVDDERQEALRQALATTRELVSPSRFDLQVLAVLMRLVVEVEGLEGVRATLSMIVKLLDESWSGLERVRALASSRDREKQDRRRGSYLDAVFAQIDGWLARQRERAAPALGQAFARDRDAWIGLVLSVDGSLARSSAKVARWESTRQALEAALRFPMASRESEGQAPREGSGSGSGAVSVAGAGAVSGEDELANGLPEPPLAPASVAPALRGDAAPARAADAPSVAQPSEPPGPTARLEVSERFRQLEQRLSAFGALLEAGQLEKARIVARDLAQTLEHFDVAAYFPALFAGYFALSARYGDVLSGPEQLDSVRRSALAELYRTDLNRFMQLQLSSDRHG